MTTDQATQERITHGVLVRLRPKPGREQQVAELLDAVLDLSGHEAHTATSFLLRFATPGDVVPEYGLLDLFTDELSRREHLAGAARQAIAYRTRDLLDGEPSQENLDVLDHSLPSRAGRAHLSTGTLLALDPQQHPTTAESITVSAASDAAWIAVRLDGGQLAVLDLTGPTRRAPIRLPEVHCDGAEVGVAATERFSLLGPDVPTTESDLDTSALIASTLPEMDLAPRSITLDATSAI
ncbi:MAG TPA: hypothetical protein PLV93_08300 [Microthrixaceae bacterium]|nr:hypothetical protein [Microthrixaceae bacterium]HNI35388.1 hypothetical protein [Microthrixaceae bacterium]